MISLRILLILISLMVGIAPAVIPASTPPVFSCPVTLPSDNRPPRKSDPFDENESTHYENGIWVSVPSDGVLELTSDDEIVFGPLAGWRSQTVTWMRADGIEGWIIVSGQRLDAESDLSPQTPLSPQRQYVRVGTVTTGIAFPSEGCWEVTGIVTSPARGDAAITWVVDVRFVEIDSLATPTP